MRERLETMHRSLPGVLPHVLNGQQAVTAISALWLRRSTAFRWLQQPIGRHLMIDVVEQVIERHQEVKNEGISEACSRSHPAITVSTSTQGSSGEHQEIGCSNG